MLEVEISMNALQQSLVNSAFTFVADPRLD